MAKVLFAWELGAGLGHVFQMQPLAQDLVSQGHQVVMALRDAAGTGCMFAGSGVSVLQAPFALPPRRYFRPTQSFAHILANNGWQERTYLITVAEAWRHLLRLVSPGLVIFDYAPTALLASRGLPVRRALIGSGFCCPPDECPFPAVLPADPVKLRRDEERLLDSANALLREWRQPELGRLGQLFSEVDENFLTTFPELEQYPSRRDARYWGPVLNRAGGKVPEWPAVEGKRIFAYLKPFDALESLLGALRNLGHPTLVYIDGLADSVVARIASRIVRFETTRLDLAKVGQEGDLAILNAGQGATAAMLLAGRPILQIPLAQEQRLTAQATCRLGAGAMALPTNPELIRRALDSLLGPGGERYAQAARAFAQKYQAFDPVRQRQEMVDRVGELLDTKPRATER